jgi:tetratricopeptide (TPR) repeat protein
MFSTFMKKAATLAALMTLLAVAASAQTTQIEGTVKLKAADGTTKPVANALVDVYRTDVAGHWNVKTDKAGHFIRLGIPIQGSFVFVVSAPEATPNWMTGVKVSQGTPFDFILSPGDGSVPTYEQVMASVKGGTAGPSTPNASAGDKAKLDAAAKERAEKVKEAQSLQTARDEAINHFKQGVALKEAKNYEGALSEFEQAAAIDPGKHASFVEVAYKSNVQLSEAHYQLGADLFNKKDKPGAKIHFEKAYEAAKKAIALASTVTDDPNVKNDLITYHNVLIKNALLLAEHYGEANVVDESVKAIDNLETLDAANKVKYEVQKGDLYRAAANSGDANMTEKAVATYKGVLASDPNNLEALYNLGIALLGSSDKEKIQESLNYLSDFAAKAPATDKRVPDTKATIEAIKTQYKIEAEKPAKRGRKP